jgi:hypothetical protein
MSNMFQDKKREVSQGRWLAIDVLPTNSLP